MGNAELIRSKLTGAARLEQLTEGPLDILELASDAAIGHGHPIEGYGAAHVGISAAAAQALFGHYSEEPAAPSHRAVSPARPIDASNLIQSHAKPTADAAEPTTEPAPAN